MEEANFYHALKIDNDRCIGCTHCMKECPTGAIRIRDGKALIHKDWCVDCGECLKSCPTEAIYVEQDDFQRIFDYKCRVALMPTVFIGQFSNVIDFLERMETTSEVRNVDFLELRACDRSCAGGVLAVANRFLTAERIMKRSMNRDKVPMIYAADNFEALSYLRQHITIRPVQPNPKRLYDGTIDEMLKKMEQVRKLMCYLPGIDCGACGSPNCQSLAEDIVRHEAQFSDCVFMQRNMEKHGKLDQEHAFRIVEKTWGKDRLNKDCYKKGAKYEGL